MSRVHRFDRGGTLKRFDHTPAGGVRVDAILTRPGVYPYRKEDGSTSMELRHPDDVFHPDTLASVKDAAVTIGHPAEIVTPENWKQYSVGHVASDASATPEGVSARLALSDASAIKQVDDDDLHEISAGYTANVTPESGEYQGQKYDSRQTDIRMNHMALLPRGKGRMGPQCALRKDAAEEVIIVKIKLDGKEYDKGSDEHIAVMQAKLDAATATAAKLVDPKKARQDAKERFELLRTARVRFGEKYMKDADGEDVEEDAVGSSNDDVTNAIVADLCPGWSSSDLPDGTPPAVVALYTLSKAGSLAGSKPAATDDAKMPPKLPDAPPQPNPAAASATPRGDSKGGKLHFLTRGKDPSKLVVDEKDGSTEHGRKLAEKNDAEDDKPMTVRMAPLGKKEDK